MKFDSEIFEGGYRLSHIHRTRRFLIVVQSAIVLVFAIYLLVAGEGLSIKPFYLGVNYFLFFVLVMLLVIVIEGFIFTLLEMRFIKSDSAKFIVTKRGFRSSIVWIIVMLFVLLILWQPILPDAVEKNLGGSGSLLATSSASPAVATMFNSDVFGITEVVHMEFESSGSAEVFILTEENYNLFVNSGKGVLGGYRINIADYLADMSISLDFPDTAHSRFYILAYSTNDVPVEVDYTITNNISSSMQTYIPLIALMFLVTHLVWVAYTFMISKRYVQEGIYR